MQLLKISSLSVVLLWMFYAKTCDTAGNYTIGFEGYGGNKNKPHSTNPPTYRPYPTHRTSSARPTHRPSPNPTYRPSKPNPTYQPPKPNPTYRPAPPKPSPTFRPSSNKSSTYRPPPPKTTTKISFKKTTPRPTGIPKPTSPPLWNIWTSNYVPSTAGSSLNTKNPSNNFKSDATLFGLYTLMRSIVDVTLSQTGQTKPANKPLRESYPYYYAVYHYNRDREKVSSKIFVPFDQVGYCTAGTSDRTCVPGTYALCLIDWTIMCITYSTATFPCHFNASLQCASGKVPCDNRDPKCAAMGNQMEVQTPCISNVVVTSPSATTSGITQGSTPDPYSSVVTGPIDLCATTILEMKRLESPVGAFVGLIGELEKVNVDFLTNFNATHYTQQAAFPTPVTVRP